jgi:16S rRNA (guanine527-N7)-methyltransferase
MLNCAVVAEVFPQEARVVDVGSGAGLPGLVLAIARVDLRVDLVEPLARRSQFLTEAVALLGLTDRVRVVRGRAEERAVRSEIGGASWVTARAVAPLDRLVGWCLPLLEVGGHVVAMKGSQAAAEVSAHRFAISKMGAVDPRIIQCGTGVIDPPVTVVLVERGKSARQTRGKS